MSGSLVDLRASAGVAVTPVCDVGESGGSDELLPAGGRWPKKCAKPGCGNPVVKDELSKEGDNGYVFHHACAPGYQRKEGTD